MKALFTSSFKNRTNIKSLSVFFATFVAVGVLASVFFYQSVKAASTYTWNQAGTASWATAANWTPTRTTPAIDDVLVFNNGATTTVTGVPTQTIGQLSISGNTIVNLQAAAAGTILTIAGGAGTDLSVAAGSQLNSNVATNTLAITVGTGATGSISGSMTYTLAAHTLIAADASGITFNSGSAFTQGTGTTGNVFGSGTSNSVVFASGSTFNQLAGSNPFQKAQPASVVVFQTGSLFSLQANITPSFSGRTYANFELNSAATITVTGAAAVSIDNLTITAGTLNFNMTATPGHAIKGNISVATGATLNFNPASAGTVNLNGSSAQTITNSGTLTFAAIESIVVGNTNGVTVNNVVTLPGTTTVNSGATLAVGATLTNSGTMNVNGSFQINQGGFAQTNDFVYGASSTLVFNNSSGSFNVSGTPAYWPSASGPPNVTVQGAGGITMNVARTVGGNFIFAAGVSSAGNLTLNGTVQVNTGGFVSGSPTYSGVSSLLKYNTGGTYGRNGEWLPGATSGAGYPRHVQLSNNTTLDLANGSTGSPFQMAGDLTIDTGSTMQMAGGTPLTQPLVIFGSVTNNGTFNLSTAAGGDSRVGGSWTNNATFNHNGRTVNLNGSIGQTVNGNTTFFNLTKASTTTQTLTFAAGSTQTVANALTLTAVSGQLLSLRSTLTGTQWKLIAPATQSVSVVDVKDSDASGGTTVTATNSINSGNNINWSFTAASTVYVDPSFTGANGTDPDGAGPATSIGFDAFSTVQGGINGVAASGTVNVAAGTYSEQLLISKSLTLHGAGTGVTNIAAPASLVAGFSGFRILVDVSSAAIVDASGITVKGPMNLSGCSAGLLSRFYGVYVRGTASLNLHDSSVLDIRENSPLPGTQCSRGTAVDVGSSVSPLSETGTLTLNNVVITGFQARAVTVDKAGSSATITNNTLTGSSSPSIFQTVILVSIGASANISGNQISGAQCTNAACGPDTFNQAAAAGISLTAPANGTQVSNNTISNNDYGINYFAAPGSTSTVNGNTFNANRYFGVNISEGNLVVSNNTFSGVSNVAVVAASVNDPANGTASNSSGTLTGNTITGATVALQLLDQTGFPADGFFPQLTAHFNRIIAPTAIDNPQNNTSDMENNWWGCNAGPGNAGCGTVNGTGADFNPWIVLGTSATPGSIPPFGNSTITADMTHNSDAVVPVGTLPDMPVAWSATNGTMAPPAGTIMAGQASSTFTSTGASSGTGCATVDNQLTCANVTVSTTVTITPAASPTATDNDYTRINNAVQATFNGQTIKLLGTFDWTEPNAAASWALGSNGIAGDLDDYSILVPANINNVTFTADNLGDATIQGPGDLPQLDLEGVFFFNGGDNQGWTLSNIRYLDFDLAIGMFSGAGGADAFNNTHITNNYIRVARDVATPTDTLQNIAIYYSFGTNQVISGNTIDIQGDAVSVAGNNAADIGLQCDTSGGNTYDGLQITNNTIHVLNAPSANPEVIIGIWENAHGHLSNITLSGNTFTNQGAGNNPATNLQRGFRVTSHSSATTTVTYQNNTVTGANIGFQWITGSNFTGNQPVVVKSNTITGNGTGVLVQSQGLGNLSFNRIVGNTVTGLNNIDGTVTAENNWWGCNAGPGNAGCDAVTGVADFNPWIVLGVSASPNPIAPFGTSTVTADMTHNSDAAAPGGGTVPPTPVAFSATNGTIAPPTGTTTAGQAGSTFASTSTSSGSACAMVDNQLICTSITVASPVNVSLPHVTGPTLSNITIPITVDDLTGKAVKTYDLQITFDPLILLPQGTPFDTAGTLSSGMTVTPNTTNPGHLIISASQATDLIGSGTLLNLKFMIIGAPGQVSALTFEDYTDPGTTFHPGFRFNAGAPVAITSNGSVHVNGPTAANGTVSGRITDDQGNPVSGATVTVSGGPTVIRAITNSGGFYSVDHLAVGDFYTVTPSRANYIFAPTNRAFSLVADKTDAVFTGMAISPDANPLESPEFFVRQQYLDFLGREPDQGGLDYWSGQLRACVADLNCVKSQKIAVSAAFFISEEFQRSGDYIYRLYRAGLSRQLTYAEFTDDHRKVVGGPDLESLRTQFAADFVQRPEFVVKYQSAVTAETFVEALLQGTLADAQVDLSNQREALIAAYNNVGNSGGDMNHSRSAVLRVVAERTEFKSRVYNSSFVLMEYFGYLQRDMDQGGFDFWVGVLSNGEVGNYRGMVCSFTTSAEYQHRFSPVAMHSNAECSGR